MNDKGRLADEMVALPGGWFQMGSDEANVPALQARFGVQRAELFMAETPRHAVWLSPFSIGRYPVTNGAFHAFVMANPTWHKGSIPARFHNGSYLAHWTGDACPPELADHPVVNVPWYAAMAYAQWAGGRLPTEAEWEYAASAGDGRAFPWGDKLPAPKRANYGESEIVATTPVGAYPPNPWGLYDLSGNVWEYCLDAWEDGWYARSPNRDPLAGGWDTLDPWQSVTTRRVIRGGSWGGAPVNLRTQYRDSHPPDGAGPHVGFRLASSAKSATMI